MGLKRFLLIILKPWNSICVIIFRKRTDMKRNVQTLRTNNVKKAQIKLSKHKELGVRSKIDIHEVASLMDTVSGRTKVENETMLFSIHMN